MDGRCRDTPWTRCYAWFGLVNGVPITKAQNQRAHNRTQSGDGQHQDVSGQHQPHLGWGKWAVMEKKKKKKKKKKKAVLLLYWRQ